MFKYTMHTKQGNRHSIVGTMPPEQMYKEFYKLGAVALSNETQVMLLRICDIDFIECDKSIKCPKCGLEFFVGKFVRYFSEDKYCETCDICPDCKAEVLRKE